MARTISRRQLLRGTAGALIGLPLLQAMGCQRATPTTRGPAEKGAAALSGAPRRFIGILVPNGVVPADWFPTGSERQFTLGRNTQSLQPYKDDVILFKGVHNQAVRLDPGENHWQGTFSLLTGRPMAGGMKGPFSATGISLDQHIAAQVGGGTRLGSLELSAEGSHSLVCLAVDRFKQFRLPLVSPLQVFGKLFGDPNLDAQALQALLQRRKSILDRVGSDYSSLAAQVGKEDRERLEAHLAAIRDVEQRLSASTACRPASKDPYAQAPAPQDWYRVMTELIVLAFQCDLTRAVTIVYRHPGGGSSYFPWLPGLKGPGGMDDPNLYIENEHHEMSHAPATRREKLHTITDWFVQQTAHLIGRLKASTEGAGTLLDQTVVLQGSDIGLGTHEMDNIPFLLAGRGGGAIRTGRYLEYGGAGVAHNRLLIAIMNAMGIPGDVFGDARVCEGGALALG